MEGLEYETQPVLGMMQRRECLRFTLVREGALRPARDTLGALGLVNSPAMSMIDDRWLAAQDHRQTIAF